MRNSIKTWIIWAAIASMPLNTEAHHFDNKNDLKNQTNIELSTVFESWEDKELLSLWIPPVVIVNAVLNYFDEEVKKYKLSPSARTQVSSILTGYFSSHNLFNLDSNWRVRFVIDNKKDFELMVKKVVNVVLDDMPFLVRKIWIPLFFWWNSAIQEKLSNLDATMMNMKESQYKDIVFDYIAWIVKRVVASINWKFTVGEFYRDISYYYPNKNWKHILEVLNNSVRVNLDIKNFRYKK